jgi:hypothetical protein
MEVSCEDLKEKGVKDVETSTEDVKLLYKPPPRFFRQSFFYKTVSLLYPSNKPKNISHRTFKEK